MKKTVLASVLCIISASAFAGGLGAQRHCQQQVHLSAPGEVQSDSCTWAANDDADMQMSVYLPDNVSAASVHLKCGFKAADGSKDVLEGVVGKKNLDTGVILPASSPTQLEGDLPYIKGSKDGDVLIYVNDDWLKQHDMYTPGDTVQCDVSYKLPSTQ
mgnify:CR=1 FL=1|jgi:hypothetical protein